MSPALLLLLTLAGLVGGLAVFLWFVALAVQGALYNQPADRLPVRSLVAGLVVGAFLAGWTYLNTRASHKDKFGTILEFSAGYNRPVTEFSAVRRERFKDADGNPRERVVPYKLRAAAAGSAVFVDADTGKPFSRATSDYVTVALVVPDGDGPPIRLSAQERDGVYVLSGGEAVFREDGGARTMTTQNLGLMVVPSAAGAVLAVAVNVLHFAAWFVAFFPVLRFTAGHAVGLTAVVGGVSLFVLVPLLFNLNTLGPAG